MRKFSEIKGDEAYDVLEGLIEPMAKISKDKELVEAVENGKNFVAVKLIIRNHRKEINTILALLEGEDPKTYEPSLLALPKMVLNVLNDEELQELF